MKIVHKIIILTLLGFTSFAQSAVQNQYQFNYLSLNPAFAGSKDAFGMTAILGNQFNGTPRPLQVSQIFSTDGTVQEGRGGVGFQAFNSTVNSISFKGIDFSYAYRIALSEDTKLAIGVDGGFLFDPVVGLSESSRFKSYLGTGLLLQNTKYFVSVAKPTLLSKQSSISSSGNPLISMIGVSLGDVERTSLNVSTLVGINKGFGNYWHLNAKMWLGQKIGLGASFRNTGTDGFSNSSSKLIYQFEYQVSTTFRIGASLDTKYQINSFTGTSNQSAKLLQLMLRFEPNFEGERNSMSFY